MPTVFSTGYACYKLIQWLHELKIRLSVSIKLYDNVKKPFNFHCISLFVVHAAQQSQYSNSSELIIIHKVAETEELEIWTGNDIYSVGCEILMEIHFSHKY